MKVVTKNFDSREDFTYWFEHTFTPEMKAIGIKHLALNTAEANTPHLAKEIYYTCEIAAIKTRFHFIVKKKRPQFSVKRSLDAHYKRVFQKLLLRR